MKLTFGKKMGIGVVLVALVGLLPLITLGFLAEQRAEEALHEDAFEKLVALRELKEHTIVSYFAKHHADLEMLVHSVRHFSGPPAENHDFFKTYIEKVGYYDFFYITPEGVVTYTVAKEPDFGTDLVNGPYRDSGLARLYRNLVQSKDFTLEDFAPYAPSKGEPAAFIGHPLTNDEGQITGYLALQVSIETINEIMQLREGLGNTGETYLVGPDKLMRSDSFLDPKNHSVKASFASPEMGKVDTVGSRKALAGETGIEIITDYNGNLVLSAYSPLEVKGLHWVVLSEIDLAEVNIPVNKLRNEIITIAGVSALVVVLVILLIAWTARDEVNFLTGVVRDLGSSSDQVAAASTQISGGAQQLSQGATEQAASLEEVSSTMEQISGQARANAESAQATAQAANQMANLVEQSHHNSVEAANLSGQAMKSAELGVKAMGQISQSMTEIRSTSDKITDIIQVINDITHQTKMLATNAAIEAARAGEQGKGFAVVADEVSKLAEHSKTSAKEIAALIKESTQKAQLGSEFVQSGSKVLNEIFDNANKLSGLISEISGFSTQQTKSMEEVEGQVENIKVASTEQAGGLDQVSEAIGQLDQVTQSNAANAEESASAAEELNSQADSLRDLILNISEHFGVQIKHAEPVGHSHSRQGKPALLPHPDTHRHQELEGRKARPQTGHVEANKTIPMRQEFKDF